MQAIDSYILERLNPQKLGPTKVFPINGDKEDIIKFLTEDGFEEIAFHTNIESTFNNGPKKRVFMCIGPFLRLADMSKGKISKENPIFFLEIQRQSYYEEYSDTADQELSAEVFKRKINRAFNWA